jgi:pimeloyl-ACP methyl ester carboxylesterase
MGRKLLALGSAIVLAACADATGVGAPLATDVSSSTASITLPPYGPWAKIVQGETGPGSLYEIHIPASWNGDAIFYSHGYRDAWSPVDLRDQDGLYAARDALGAMGYAVAYSSWSQNGFALKDGAQRMHQLRALLASEAGGQPARSFLVAHSLGSGVGLHLVEQFPDQYDGALLMCGLVGGSLTQTQYLGHVRALFDFFYPGALPGSATFVPLGTILTIQQVAAAVQSNPLGLLVIASALQTPLPYIPSGSVMDPNSLAAQTLVGSLYGALGFHARGIANVIDLTHGHLPLDNHDTVYEIGPNPLLPTSVLAPIFAQINANVGRFTMPQPARNYLTHYFTPSGNLQIPVLSVHNLWDPGVPAFHENVLLNAVTNAGATGNLLQRYELSFGHCNIPVSTALQGFLDLVGWVTTGTKPSA